MRDEAEMEPDVLVRARFLEPGACWGLVMIVLALLKFSSRPMLLLRSFRLVVDEAGVRQ